MMIRDLMSSPAVTVTTDTSVAEALGLLDRYQITAMPVVDRRGRLTGVVSEADLIRDAEPLDAPARSAIRLTTGAVPRRIGEMMTHQVVSVRADDDVEVAVELMVSSTLKSLPVLLHDRVVGVISRRDLIHALATRDQRIRAELMQLLRAESDDLCADVRDGVAIVTGALDDHQRRIAEVLAGAVPGVVAIEVR